MEGGKERKEGKKRIRENNSYQVLTSLPPCWGLWFLLPLTRSSLSNFYKLCNTILDLSFSSLVCSFRLHLNLLYIMPFIYVMTYFLVLFVIPKAKLQSRVCIFSFFKLSVNELFVHRSSRPQAIPISVARCVACSRHCSCQHQAVSFAVALHGLGSKACQVFSVWPCPDLSSALFCLAHLWQQFLKLTASV